MKFTIRMMYIGISIMDKTLITDWINALRSDKYRQGQTYLKYGDNEEDSFCYCCLGVLADIHKDIIFQKPEHGSSVASYTGVLGSATSLTPFCDQLQLCYDLQNILIGMNDGSQKSFDEIADFIEENKEIFASSLKEQEEFCEQYRKANTGSE